MSNYLANLAGRALGVDQAIRPRLGALFEPVEVGLDTMSEALPELVLEVDSQPAARPPRGARFTMATAGYQAAAVDRPRASVQGRPAAIDATSHQAGVTTPQHVSTGDDSHIGEAFRPETNLDADAFAEIARLNTRGAVLDPTREESPVERLVHSEHEPTGVVRMSARAAPRRRVQSIIQLNGAEPAEGPVSAPASRMSGDHVWLQLSRAQTVNHDAAFSPTVSAGGVLDAEPMTVDDEEMPSSDIHSPSQPPRRRVSSPVHVEVSSIVKRTPIQSPLTAQRAPEPTVQVTIGRIEIRATPPPNNQVTPRSPAATSNLQDYLRSRERGGVG